MAEQDPLAGGAAGEHAVGAVPLQELDHRLNGSLVDGSAAGSQRRGGGDDEGWAVSHPRKGTGFPLVAAQAAG